MKSTPITNALLLVASTIFAVVLAEVIARNTVQVQPLKYVSDNGFRWNSDHPRRSYALTPGYRGRIVATEFDTKVSINSLGFRGPEPNLKAASSRQRILVIGDSFVFGIGVDFENTIPARIEEHLRNEDVNADVWNLGVPSYGLPQYVDVLEEYARFDVDHVVLCIFTGKLAGTANDIFYAGSFEKWRKGIPTTWRTRTKKWLKRNSTLFNLVHLHLAPRLRTARHRGDQPEVENEETMRRGWLEARNLLRRVERQRDESGFGVTLVYIPVIYDLLNGYSEASEQLADLADAHGFGFVDGSKLMSERDPREYYYPVDAHLNAAGYDLFAREIVKRLSSTEWQADLATADSL